MGAAENQVRFIAHGIGLELDEIPVMAPRFDDPFEAGTVMAVEPKIFYPRIGGAGVENTYIIGESGCERLLSSPMDWFAVWWYVAEVEHVWVTRGGSSNYHFDS